MRFFFNVPPMLQPSTIQAGLCYSSYLHDVVISLDQILVLNVLVSVSCRLVALQLVVNILGQEKVAFDGVTKTGVADVGRNHVQICGVLFRLG